MNIEKKKAILTLDLNFKQQTTYFFNVSTLLHFSYFHE